MTTYVVLLSGDEVSWENATPEEQAAVFAKHEEFSQALAARGHKLTGGEELTHSRTTKKVARSADGSLVVTDGPYAETAEHLGGFYVVESDDLDDLIQLCAILAEPGSTPVEVRAAVDHSGEG